MKSHKIMLFGCSVFTFFAVTSLVGCAAPAPTPTPTPTPGPTYKANVKSRTLVIDKQIVVVGENFDAKISLADNVGDTYFIPTKLQKVSINGFDVDDSRYNYNPSTGDFSVMSNYLTGDIVITAEADKITKTPGDYAHLYVANSNSVAFTFENLLVGHYLVNGVAHGQALQCVYNAPGGRDVEVKRPLIEIKSYGTYTFRFKTIDDKDINDYVTASIVKVYEDGEDGARYQLLTKYNKKLVAFKYVVPVNFDEPDFHFRPLIATGAQCLADVPENLKDLFSTPSIYTITDDKFAITELEKKGSSNHYYIGASNDAISMENGNYFVGYFDGINEGNNALEISTEVAGDDCYRLSLAHDSVHQVFVFYNTSVNGSYYAFNSEPTFSPSSVYSVSNFEQIQMPEKNIFSVSNELSVFVTYKLKPREQDCLFDYGIGEYKNNVVGSSVSISKPSDYNSKTVVFGAKLDAEGKETPLSSMNLGVAEERNPAYSHIVAVASTKPEIIRDDAFYGFGSELNNDGEKVKTFFVKFVYISQIVKDGKYVNYYAPLVDSTLQKVNYYEAPDDIQSVTLDKVCIPFNDNVSVYDNISFSSKHPILVKTEELQSITYDNSGDLYFGNAFAGVPYKCEINPAPAYYGPKTKDVELTINDVKVVDPIIHKMDENILSFTPPTNATKITITAKDSGDFTIDYLSHKSYRYEKRCAYLGPVHLHETTRFMLEPSDGWEILQLEKEKYILSDFTARSDKTGKSITPSQIIYVDMGLGKLELVYSNLDVESLLENDAYKATFIFDTFKIQKYVTRHY